MKVEFESMDETTSIEPQEAPPLESPRVLPEDSQPDGELSPELATPPKSIVREYFQFAVETLIMFLLFMTFTAQAVEVPTASMQNTILVGDHLLINKFVFAPGTSLPFLPQREIRRGDIVVFKYPGNDYDPGRDRPEYPRFKTYYVKRVVGMPGDKVEVRGTSVLINGEPLPEQVVNAKKKNDAAPLDIQSDQPESHIAARYKTYYDVEDHGEYDDPEFELAKYIGDRTSVTVPDGSYFVMGDNRDDSEDSRVWGFVKRDLIVGRPMFVLWSYDRSKSIAELGDMFGNMRWSRIGTRVK